MKTAQTHFREWGEKIAAADTLQAKWELIEQMERSIPEGEEKEEFERLNSIFGEAVKRRDAGGCVHALRTFSEQAPQGYPKEGKAATLQMARIFEIAHELYEIRMRERGRLMEISEDEERRKKIDSKMDALDKEFEALFPPGESNFKDDVDKFMEKFESAADSLGDETSMRQGRRMFQELSKELELLHRAIPRKYPLAIQAVFSETLLLANDMLNEILEITEFVTGLERFVDNLEKGFGLKD